MSQISSFVQCKCCSFQRSIMNITLFANFGMTVQSRRVFGSSRIELSVSSSFVFFSNPPPVCPRFSQLTLCELGLVDRTRRTSVLRVLETRSPLRSAFSGTDPNGGFLRVRPPSSLGFGGRNGRHRTWRVVWRPVLRQTPGALRGGSLGALERFQGSGSRWSWWGRWEWNTGAAWSRGVVTWWVM